MRLVTRYPVLAAVAVAGFHFSPAVATTAAAQAPPSLHADIDQRTEAVLPKVVAWRRDIHQHPELSGEEVRTSALVAEHLRALGLDVRTGVGGHGVVGVLRGARPGPAVALRADMDALPVTEINELPFRSQARAMYRGQEVGVMHACGHDLHVAILMGAAEVLTALKDQLAGTITFVFQPAEEGLPDGSGGAEKMIADGVLDAPRVDAIFGLHVGPGPLGHLTYRPGPALAAVNSYTLTVFGKQAHGAMPWMGVDPVVASSQIVLGMQAIVSRQTDITAIPAVLTVGAINGGVRNNIIPDSVVMLGTIRTFSRAQRDDIFTRLERTATQIAGASGARTTLVIDSGYPVTHNDTALTERMVPTLRRVAGEAGISLAPLITGAEDFSFFQERVPGVFVNLGVTPRDQDWRTVASNHSPLFFADEGALPTGVRLMAGFAVDYLLGGPR